MAIWLDSAGTGIQYAREQNMVYYETMFPLVSVRFIDESRIDSDVKLDEFGRNESSKIRKYFGSQNIIYLSNEYFIPCHVQFSSFETQLDPYNLSEIPEAIVTFSDYLLDVYYERGDIKVKPKIQEDVMITHNNIEWRITKEYPSSYFGHEENVFLEWIGLLERNKKTNATNSSQINT